MTPRLLLPLLVAALACAASAAAASPGKPEQAAVVLGNREIAAALAVYRPGGPTAHAIAPADEFRYWGVVRTRAGSVERHRDWVDVTVIRSGSGILRTGTSVRGGVETASGEWRGGRIVDPRERHVAAGDIVVIPAGTPHQFLPAGGRPLAYVTVKVPAVPSRHPRGGPSLRR